MARLRRRGDRAVLRAAAPRGRHDHVDAAETHRRKHRLALRQRAQEGAESMIDRRTVVRFGALASAAGVLGLQRVALAAEPQPEGTAIRLGKVPSICVAPQYVAEELLRAEGFSRIEYVGTGMQAGGVPGAEMIGRGEADISMNFAGPLVIALDRGVPISLLGGVHVG